MHTRFPFSAPVVLTAACCFLLDVPRFLFLHLLLLFNAGTFLFAELFAIGFMLDFACFVDIMMCYHLLRGTNNTSP